MSLVKKYENVKKYIDKNDVFRVMVVIFRTEEASRMRGDMSFKKCNEVQSLSFQAL